MKILVIGGNRFFGKKLVGNLISTGHEVTLLNRQNSDDGFGSQIHRIKCDRKDSEALANAIGNSKWDIIYDQVCFEATDAAAACRIFRGKTPKYVFTSTVSVYDYGGNLKEEDFDPFTFHYSTEADSKEQYAEAKRQCESEFFSQNDFKVVAVRLPIVVGPDDYTKRLKWHVDRIKNCEAIYFPNINAQLSLIHSTDAGLILSQLANKEFVGPINVCSAEPIQLSALVEIIENVVGKKAIISDVADSLNHSTFGFPKDWFMNTKRLHSLNLEAREIHSWISELVMQLMK